MGSEMCIRDRLFMAQNSSITLTGAGGYIYSQSSITASAFFGDGSHLTGIAASVPDGSVTTPKLAPDAVTADAILDGSITSSKLATGANSCMVGAGSHSVLCQGDGNTTSGYAATVGGGESNVVDFNYATISGGSYNYVTDNLATIGGGAYNVADFGGTVGGGGWNIAGADYATVPGGYNNFAAGAFSFAAGSGAIASAQGSFVWSDSQGSLLGNTTDQFLVKAQGGFYVDSSSFHYVNSGASRLYIDSTGVAVDTGTVVSTLTVNGIIGFNYGLQSYGIGHGYAFPDARGMGAIDLQTARTDAFQVASGAFSVIGGGKYNIASGIAATVGGGDGNIAGTNYATISGGSYNYVTDNVATIGGGYDNTAGGVATIGGGAYNVADHSGTVGGGGWNIADAYYSMVGGGMANTASGSWATVPGGFTNFAAGDYSFAAGYGAAATAQGSFVWSDSQGSLVGNTTDQFLVKAQGGFYVDSSSFHYVNSGASRLFIDSTGKVGIGTTSPGQKLSVVGTIESTSGGFKFPDGSVQTSAGNSIPTGTILTYAGSTATIPTGWLLCDGSAYSRTGTYQGLYQVIDTYWGTGDGSTTFNVPDLRGVFLRGANDMGTSAGAASDSFSDPDSSSRTTRNGTSTNSVVGSYQTDNLVDHQHYTTGNTVDQDDPDIGYVMWHTSDIFGVSSTVAHKETRPRNAYILFIIKT